MIINPNEYDIEMTDEEVAFLIMKYLHEAHEQGREFVPLSEVFTYLECEMPDDMEEQYLVIHPEIVDNFNEELSKRNKLLN